MANEPEPKPLVWMGSSRRDFRDFPDEVKAAVGYALFVAQQGSKHASAKVLKGFGGADVVEIKADYRSDTFRTVYTVRVAGVVYVLHAFQKKSKKGSETPKPDLELIEKRLRDVERMTKEAK